MLRDLFADLRYGVRMLLRNPGFTAVGILSLALGIGASTAVFSVIDPLLLKKLPVPDAEKLVLFERIDGDGSTGPSVAYPIFRGLRDRNHVFSGLFVSQGAQTTRASIEGSSGERETIRFDLVSGGFFSTLGVDATLGRIFTESDEDSVDSRVAVLSENYWKKRFAGDSQVIGKTLNFSGSVVTIIGVAPAGFSGFEIGFAPDMWIPLRVSPTSPLNNLGSRVLRMMARLRPGVTLAQATAEVGAIYRQLIEEAVPGMEVQTRSQGTPEQRAAFISSLRASGVLLQPGATGWTDGLRGKFAKPLWILMVTVSAVLLIACANVASLLLTRNTARRKEIAVRLAIGGGPSRVIRQLLTESALLAGLGGIAGLVLAPSGAQLILSYVTPDVAAALYKGPDARIFGFTAAASLLSAIFAGLIPAVRAARLNLSPDLKEHGGVSAGRPRLLLNRGLVVSQVALSLVLLTGAGLFIRTLDNLRGLDPGFEKQNVLFFSLDRQTGSVQRGPAEWMNLLKEIKPRLETLPGVQSVSLSLQLGLLSQNSASDSIEAEGYVPRSGEKTDSSYAVGGADFFETLGTPLILGRDFRPGDETSSPRVAVINETMAKYFFDESNPIGKRFKFGSNGPVEIVGVARDTKYRTLREPGQRVFYLPFSYSTDHGGFGPRFLLRASTPDGLDARIREVLSAADPKLLPTPLQSMDDVVESTLVQERLVVRLAGALSAVALFLACVGLYGTLSYSVTQRTHEIGVRMALGARTANVVGMLMWETGSLLGIGIILGLAGGVLAMRPVAGLLFELSPTDPLTLAAAALMLGAASGLAVYVPARRASRFDPLTALRHE